MIYRAAIGLALLTCSLASIAREIPYGAVNYADLARCDEAFYSGRISPATRCYQELLASGAPLAERAEAAWAIGDVKAANTLFQSAMAQNEQDLQTLTRWGELFADTHQNREAMEIFEEVLAAEPAHPFALMGAARVLAKSFDQEVAVYLTPLLEASAVAPGAQLRALLLDARMAMERSAPLLAAGRLQQALDLAAEHSFNAYAVHALRAALAKTNSVDASPMVAAAIELNPASGLVHVEIAHVYEITRRYSLAIDELRAAVEREPSLAAAHETLGINLMRLNDFDGAREHLETAYEHDPFSPVTVNTLRLLDSYTRFTVISDTATGDNEIPVTILLRLRTDEAAAIAPYAIALTRKAIAVFSDRYRFQPTQPIVIEMYPDHDDFAVRTAGMPGLGILGVAFGYLVAMDSPSGRPVEEFQWGTTLWHELAHVFTLSATDHLVPRWYSEGLSVYEEWVSGPNPGVRIPPSVYAAFAEDRLLPINELNGGFVRPSYPNQVIVSYMQAGLVCQYIAEKFGEEALADLLAAFGEGLSTADAIAKVLPDDAATLDEKFLAWVETHHARTYNSLDAWRSATASANTALANEDYHAAIVAARPAIEMYPGYVESDSARLALAKAEVALGNIEDALASYQSWVEHGGYDPAALKDYADLVRQTDENRRATELLARVNDVAPLDASFHVKLAEWLLADGDSSEAIRELEVALELEPFDRARVLYLKAQAHRDASETEIAIELLYQALTIAPDYRDAQKLLVALSRDT